MLSECWKSGISDFVSNSVQAIWQNNLLKTIVKSIDSTSIESNKKY